MASPIYNPVSTYTFRDSLPNSDPQKTIKGALFDAEFNAIHTASTDAVSLTANNTITGANTLSGNNTYSGTSAFSKIATFGPVASGSALNVIGIASTTSAIIQTPFGTTQTSPQLELLSTASNGNAMLALVGNNGVLGTNGLYLFHNGADASGNLTVLGNANLNFFTNATNRLQINGSGAISIAAPTSGISLSINALGSGTASCVIAAPTGTSNSFTSGGSLSIGNSSTTGSSLQNNGGQTEIWQFNGSWNQVTHWDSNRSLTLAPASSTNPELIFGNPGGLSPSMSFGANHASGGTATPSLSASKPGANAGVLTWLSVTVNGTQGWIPVWAN